MRNKRNELSLQVFLFHSFCTQAPARSHCYTQWMAAECILHANETVRTEMMCINKVRIHANFTLFNKQHSNKWRRVNKKKLHTLFKACTKLVVLFASKNKMQITVCIDTREIALLLCSKGHWVSMRDYIVQFATGFSMKFHLSIHQWNRTI